jgi:hypothetical protein
MYTGELAVFSNREDWEFQPMDIYDDDAGEAIDLTSATIAYGIYDENGCQILSGASGDSTVTLVEDTVFQIAIPRSSITSRCAGSYRVGITVENADITKSLIAGTISVLNGNVSA